MKYKSELKAKLGSVSSKSLKKDHDAKGSALKSKIEGKRKAITKHVNEKERTGNKLFD